MKESQDMKQIIQTYLRTKFPERKGLEITSMEKKEGGFSYETYFLTTTWSEAKGMVSEGLVVRMEPDEGCVPPYDVRPQYEVLKRIYGTGISVPKVYFLEEDTHILGHRFYVMERIEGDILYYYYEGNPEPRNRLEEDYATILARLHALDWQSLGLSILGVPESYRHYVEKEIARWERVIEENQFLPRPAIAEIGIWLKENIPQSGRITLCHGDYHTLNFLARDGRIVALLDWEMVGLGDPLSDLGWGCLMRQSYLLFGRILEGFWDEISFIRRYQEISGVDVDDDALFFWKIFAHFKYAAITLAGRKASIGFKDPNMRLAFPCFSWLPVAVEQACRMLGL